MRCEFRFGLCDILLLIFLGGKNSSLSDNPAALRLGPLGEADAATAALEGSVSWIKLKKV
jgi:hypothetical protein